ncbi:flagellar basal body P-ring formation chaperone FlgA [Pseudidiomarina insulisalsae]|uniref:Flagella basal body P-ring formation protein FlgA n=1 Tax=Pseudidiomarina insulisalsae TaxID=575789 RepID=A0A432YDM8_9GAMM|nr:flagellar basal body P-ring formation chaperone FlgA [Pseudidiomarina insulisalsae]RUO59033.1 flagella basal body P-ring formation protein FlgA [Pseudidiomarina insulisalsae]
MKYVFAVLSRLSLTLALAFSLPAAFAANWQPQLDKFLAQQLQPAVAEFSWQLYSAEPVAKALEQCQQPLFAAPQQLHKVAGRISVQVHCAESVSPLTLHLQVDAWVDYYVADRRLTARQPITTQDLRLQRGNLARLPTDIITDAAALQGQQLKRNLAAGSAVRSSLLEPVEVITYQDQVKVVYRGPGFAIEQVGVALQAGAIGDTIRVRLQQRQIILAEVTGRGQVIMSH